MSLGTVGGRLGCQRDTVFFNIYIYVGLRIDRERHRKSPREKFLEAGNSVRSMHHAEPSKHSTLRDAADARRAAGKPTKDSSRERRCYRRAPDCSHPLMGWDGFQGLKKPSDNLAVFNEWRLCRVLSPVSRNSALSTMALLSNPVGRRFLEHGIAPHQLADSATE